jgi:alkylhydroperoxidase family enzyme
VSWIESIPESEAGPELRALYERARDPAAGVVDEVLRVHSLHPFGLAAHLALYQAVMRGTKTLPKVERELVAFVVSSINACHY